MKTKKSYKTSTLIVSLTLAFFMGAAQGSEIPEFDLEADVKLLTNFFKCLDERPKVERQYKTDTRRYVSFDVTEKRDLVQESLFLLQDNNPFAYRIFHNRPYHVLDQKGVDMTVYEGLRTEGSNLFVRSSPLKFDSEYWALYELFVPAIPTQDMVEEDQVKVFTQHFFAIFYREYKF